MHKIKDLPSAKVLDTASKSSKNDSNGSSGLLSIGSHKERKYDTIPFRLDFIKELLNGKELEPMLDFDECDTETFINPNGYKSYNNDSNSSNSDDSSYDIRIILNRKMHDFYKVINDIGGKLLYIKSGQQWA
jgi:hypothetical protein